MNGGEKAMELLTLVLAFKPGRKHVGDGIPTLIVQIAFKG